MNGVVSSAPPTSGTRLPIDASAASSAIATVPQIARRRIRLGEQTLLQLRRTGARRYNRTLEVWGSIPRVSTSKQKGLAVMRGFFVFGFVAAEGQGPEGIRARWIFASC